MTPSTLPSKAAFGEHVGSGFQLAFPDQPDGSPVAVTLTELTDGAESAEFEAFSLVFSGPEDAPVHQAICRLDHPVLGPMELFVVPIGRDADGVRYEAVLNRRRERNNT